MAQTPVVSATYCSAAQLLIYHDWQQVADLVRDGNGPRPQRAALLDPNQPSGAILAGLLGSATGQLNSAALIGNRYTPDDLAALTDAGLLYLQKIVADLAYWQLAQRRQPMSANPDSVPGAREALETLEKLKNGERVFAFAETADAGLPEVVVPRVTSGPQTVRYASRLFGSHGNGNQQGYN